MANKKFSDADMIAALNQNEMNVTHAAKQLGVSRAAVIKRRNELPQGALIPKEEFESRKMEAMQDLQRVILQSITPEQISKASLQMKMSAIGILEDKMSMIKRGNTTQHMVHVLNHNMSDDYTRELKEFIKRETDRKRRAVESDYEAEAEYISEGVVPLLPETAIN